jgi:cell division protein FtsW
LVDAELLGGIDGDELQRFGFGGVAGVIGLFALIAWRAFSIGAQAARLERSFQALVAQGVGLWISAQALINMGVNMGVLPTKGLTLPMLSFGGSAVLANCLALALLLRVDYENRRLMKGMPA